MESFCILFYNSKIKLLLAGVIFFGFSTVAFSQGRKATLKKNDSVNINSEFNRKLSIIDGQRIKDSIKGRTGNKLLSLKNN
jgi:hypothetical protein